MGIERIAEEKTGITADTAIRLSKALGTSEHFWLNLQNEFDIRVAKNEHGKDFDQIQSIQQHAA